MPVAGVSSRWTFGDKDFLDLVETAHLTFKGAADGEIAFGALKGFLDVRYGTRDGSALRGVLVLPACNREAMQLHLDEIATKVTPGAHAMGCSSSKQAGMAARFYKVPHNISLMPLPPRAPELNGQENIWQFMRQNWLSNRVFKSFDDIVDHCCYAWNTLIDQPWKIMSVARRDWATVGYYSMRGLYQASYAIVTDFFNGLLVLLCHKSQCLFRVASRAAWATR